MKKKMMMTIIMELALLPLVMLFGAAAAPTAAQIPQLPHYFYGTIRIEGVPAPAGTTIEARAAGALTGSFNPITTTQVGKYGDVNPSVVVPRLLVQGNIAEGVTVEFYVNGVKATQTAAWHSGQTTQLDLTANQVLPPLAVTTGAVLSVGAGEAILTGNLPQLGGAAMAVVTFQWGTTQAYDNETIGQIKSTTGAFTATLNGLPPDTMFHYRAKAVAGQTVVTGTDQTFRTEAMAIAPAVSTLGATVVSTTTAILNGSLAQWSGSLVVNFQWGTTEDYGNETTGQTLNAPGAFTSTLSGLLPDTVYHYRARAVAGQAIAYGPDITFRTGAVIPPDTGAGGGAGGGGTSVVAASLPASVILSGLSSEGELKVDSSGRSQGDNKLRDTEGKVTLSINSGTSLKSSSGAPLTSLYVTAPIAVPQAPPQNAVVTAQEMGPSGANFSPAITMTLAYDPAKLPASVLEKDLIIAFWDGSAWVPLGTTVDTATKTVSARVNHFTVFAILGKITTKPAVVPSLAIESLDTTGGTVKVMVSVKDLKLVTPRAENVAGEGHIHYYLDVDIPTIPGKRTETAPGTYKASTEMSIVWENLKPDQHTLGAQLVKNDHTPFEPPITVMIKVTVSAPAASATPAPAAAPTPSPSAAPSPAPDPALVTTPTPTPAEGPGEINRNLIYALMIAGGMVIILVTVLVLRRRLQPGGRNKG